jgi:hypothetical protein
MSHPKFSDRLVLKILLVETQCFASKETVEIVCKKAVEMSFSTAF